MLIKLINKHNDYELCEAGKIMHGCKWGQQCSGAAACEKFDNPNL